MRGIGIWVNEDGSERRRREKEAGEEVGGEVFLQWPSFGVVGTWSQWTESRMGSGRVYVPK